MTTPVILGFSGNLNTSVALAHLRDQGAVVVTLTLDLGQGADLEEVRARALGLGAVRAHVLDARDEFARDCVLPALQSGAFHDARSPISHIAHTLIARKLVEVASIEKADAVAHGGDPADHASIQAAVTAVDSHLHVIAVTASLATTREERMAYALEHAIPSTADARTRRRPGRHIDTPAHLDVRFESGVPVSVNDVAMPLVELMESLETIAADHGIGGGLSPSAPLAAEVPGAVVLADAYGALTRGAATLPTGVVRVRLFQGEHSVVGHSPVALR